MDIAKLLERLREIRKTSHGFLQPKDRDDLTALVDELDAEVLAETPPVAPVGETPPAATAEQWSEARDLDAERDRLDNETQRA